MNIIYYLILFLLIISFVLIIIKYFSKEFLIKTDILIFLVFGVGIIGQLILIFFANFFYTFTLFINTLFIFIITTWVFIGHCSKKIFFSLNLCILWGLSQYVGIYCCQLLINNYELQKIVEIVCAQLLLFCIITAMAKLIKQKNVLFTRKHHLTLLLIPYLTWIVIICVFITANRPSKGNFDSGIICVLIIIINICNFYNLSIYSRMNDNFELERINLVYENQIKICNLFLREKEKTIEITKEQHHDIKQHFIFILEMAKSNQNEKLIRYIDELMKIDTSNGMGIAHSGNMILDAIINYKYNIMRKNKIEFKLCLESPNTFKFNNTDICIILGNILDNAIEACLKINKRWINLAIKYTEGALLVKTRNSYDGIIKKDIWGTYESTKDRPENHGNGLVSIKKAIENYKGTCKIIEGANVFEISILIYEIEKNI